MKHLFFTFSLFLALALSAQNNAPVPLKTGDVCPALVVNTAENSIQSFIFPHNKKITFIHFWSSTNPQSMNDFYRYSLIYKKYANEEYKTGDGFDVILVALQSDKKAWTADIEKYNLKDMNNGICLKGFNDFYVKNFKLSETPTSFLVDESGKIIAVDPDVNSLVNFLDEKRDYSGENKPVSRIDGKILVGKENFSPLINEKIYLINNQKDTIQVTSTNESGKFSISNPSMEGLTLNIHKSHKIGENDQVLLANEKDVIVSAFKKGTNEFEYRLLDLELSFLKPIVEPEVKLKSFIKDLYFSENLYEDGGFVLSAKSKTKLDALLVKFKNYPGATVEIISHSDCRGSSESNAALSLKRSTAVANYFMSKGVLRDKIKAIGKGEEEPVNHCVDGVPCSEKELAENRRTEFRFYKSE